MCKDVVAKDGVILISGDGDLVPAVKEVKQRDIHLTLIAKENSVYNELRNLADEFISLESIQDKIAKEIKVIA